MINTPKQRIRKKNNKFTNSIFYKLEHNNKNDFA